MVSLKKIASHRRTVLLGESLPVPMARKAMVAMPPNSSSRCRDALPCPGSVISLRGAGT
jgi:hypothetical protein